MIVVLDRHHAICATDKIRMRYTHVVNIFDASAVAACTCALHLAKCGGYMDRVMTSAPTYVLREHAVAHWIPTWETISISEQKLTRYVRQLRCDSYDITLNNHSCFSNV